MARNEARIRVDIWEDTDYTAIPFGPQWAYEMLLSQRDLSYAGVLALRERRWSRCAAGLTEPQVHAFIEDLETARFVVVDYDTEELLVRSFIRGDRVYKQPNLLASAVDGMSAIASPKIRAALIEELHRVAELPDFPEGSREPLGKMLDALEKAQAKGADRGSGNPSGMGSANPSDRGSEEGTANQHRGSSTDRTEVIPLIPVSPSPPKTSSSEIAIEPEPPPDRADVERICAYLADRIAANGSRRPTVSRKWRQAARLMLDRDGRTEDQVIRAIDWCQDDEFWRGNVLSMPKLRDQYDRLRLAAQRKTPSNGVAVREQRPSTTDQRVAAGLALAAQLHAREAIDDAG